jgi:hypothetical protein
VALAEEIRPAGGKIMSLKMHKYKLSDETVLTPVAHKLFSDLIEYAEKLELEVSQLTRERFEKDECIKACEKRENDLIDRIRAGL